MATLLSTRIILRVGSRPTQLFFQAARERMTAQNPPATHVVGSGEVHVDKDKVGAVDNWEAPKDIKGI